MKNNKVIGMEPHSFCRFKIFLNKDKFYTYTRLRQDDACSFTFIIIIIIIVKEVEKFCGR